MNQAPIVQQFQSPQVQGKMVSNFNQITANDVPMNGNFAYFPKNDGSEISVRRWNNNGTIAEYLYVPYKPNTATPQEKTDNLPSNDIESLYKSISERLDRIEKLVTPAKKGKTNESTNNSKSDVE